MSSSKHLVSEKKEIKYLVRNLICSLFPKKKMILLESHPDLSCNTYELFRYMIDNHVELHDWISDRNLQNRWTNNTIVYVYCDIKELIHLLSKECYIPFSEWREPDYNNEITAIAIWNQDIAHRARYNKHIQEYIDKLEIIKAGS